MLSPPQQDCRLLGKRNRCPSIIPFQSQVLLFGKWVCVGSLLWTFSAATRILGHWVAIIASHRPHIASEVHGSSGYLLPSHSIFLFYYSCYLKTHRYFFCIHHSQIERRTVLSVERTCVTGQGRLDSVFLSFATHVICMLQKRQSNGNVFTSWQLLGKSSGSAWDAAAEYPDLDLTLYTRW